MQLVHTYMLLFLVLVVNSDWFQVFTCSYSSCQLLCALVIIIPSSIPSSLSVSQVYRVPEVYIFQFNAPLYFANVGVFRSRLYIETGVNPNEFEERDVGCFQQCCTRVRGEG